MDFRLVLVRHGETGHNAGGILQGQLDIPLSATGISQSKLLFNTLKSITWNEVWSSDLMRAWQTANFALNNSICNLDDEILLLNPLPPINTDSRLRERNYGEAQGKSKADLHKMAGEGSISDLIPPGAESSGELRERVISFFEDLCRRQTPSTNNNNTNILIFSHNGWIREFLAHLTCVCKSDTDFTKTAGQTFPNTAVSQFQISLDSNDGSVSHIQCISLNDSSHLSTDTNLCEEIDF